MFNEVYFKNGLSQAVITDELINEAFAIKNSIGKDLISLSNARNNKANFDSGNNFCIYCDTEHENPMNYVGFRLFCNDLEEYRKTHNAYFYSGQREDANTLTTDHINPHSRGGSYTNPENLTPSCKSCNKTKKDLTFREFYENHLIKNPNKYGNFVAEMQINPDYDKFVKALDFVATKTIKVQNINDNVNTTKKNKLKINQTVGVCGFDKYYELSPKSIRGEKQIFIFLNTKVKSIRKMKLGVLEKALLVLTEHRELYTELVSQVFDLSNFDFEYAIDSIKKYIDDKYYLSNNTKSLKMNFSIETSEDDYWFEHNGNILYFKDMSLDKLKSSVKNLRYCVRIKSNNFIPNYFIDRDKVDLEKVYKRFQRELTKRLEQTKLCVV